MYDFFAKFIAVTIGLFFFWLKIKDIMHQREFDSYVENLNPEFFNQRRARIFPDDYFKWLRRFYGELTVIVMDTNMRGMKAREKIENAVILTEKEIENFEQQTGKKIFFGKKASDYLKK